MNFDKGFQHSRFFVAWIISDVFCGLSFHIGKDFFDDGMETYSLGIQIGYGKFHIGFIVKESK